MFEEENKKTAYLFSNVVQSLLAHYT